ncbi:lysine transporter LysE [Lutibacter sp. A80]|uniref:lysine transporter LysE n=1 Tax=Lutibacter sp. A80 TaxID=2918453 RepID=UPI001F068572|nr:lysine transporter LysE [Lutibacter sp. A80]UMB61654.1 lysine transporter LysE [Lutibacter sp. A80]
MDYFYHILYGTFMAYFGLISPGMLNMTALKIRINTGKYESVKFAIGASIVVFLQASIALYFADYFLNNPAIITTLKKIAIFVFCGLSIFFFFLSKKELNPKQTKTNGNFLIKGMGLSAINMLAIPFYLGLSIYLTSIDKLIIEQPYIMLFVFGAGLGSFLIFYTYIVFANFIIKKVSFIARNINLILSLLFLVLAIYTLIKILN